ncbi:MAG: ion transporter [Gammaproteobacteria bacterium]|nr:ion transporter [Gammaproteobacteria bacterium]
MRQVCQKIVKHRYFDPVIIGFILLNGLILGLETSADLVTNYGQWMVWGNQFILGIFIIEAILKITAVAPQFKKYFGNGWNLFDFSIVVLSLIPASGEFAMLARMARLLRVLRLISVIPELRLIVATLARSIPSMGNIILLMSLIFYIYAVAGYHLFHLHDPEHWQSLGLAMLTLFRVVTLEDWTDLMYTAMEMSPYAWIYFVSFVVLGTFVIINLFIAVVINNLDEVKTERLKELEQPVKRDEMLKELRQTQRALESLRQKLERSE